MTEETHHHERHEAHKHESHAKHESYDRSHEDKVRHEHRVPHARPHHNNPRPARHRPNNNWMYAALVLAGALVMSLFFHYAEPSVIWRGASSGAENAVDLDTAANNVMDLLENDLVGPESTITLVNKSTNKGLYRFFVDIDGQELELYASPDGKLLFTGVIDMENPPDYSGGDTAPAAAIDDPSVLLDDDAMEGDPNAPITIVEFSDFECPFCGMFYTNTYPQLVEEYIDTGLVNLVFRDYPLDFHPSAQKAAEAAECAGDQGKYFEMHNMLFENQEDLEVDSLKQYAKDLGLNTKVFDDCLDSSKYEEETQLDLADGQAYGVSGTPAFFVNGRLLEGALPIEEFQSVIEEELSAYDSAMLEEGSYPEDDGTADDAYPAYSEDEPESDYVEGYADKEADHPADTGDGSDADVVEYDLEV